MNPTDLARLFVNLGLGSTFEIDNVAHVLSIDTVNFTIRIPLPHTDSGLHIVGSDVPRALDSHWVVIEGENRNLDFLELLSEIIQGRIKLDTINNGDILDLRAVIAQTNIITAATKVQTIVNELVNRLPLHESSMKTWLINNRVEFLDPKFNTLSPDRKLEYQTQKQIQYHPWKSIGLSDDSAASKNLILKVDLRDLAPFGRRHHNPMRNLYSTVQLYGDELPKIRTKTENNLIKQGISRKGFNWLTAFIETPQTFEDQILVNAKHKTKFIKLPARITTFGVPEVKQFDTLSYGQVLSLEPNDTPKIFDRLCDLATVTEIVETETVFNGYPTRSWSINLELTYCLKTGVKITNQFGNKGIVHLVPNLGVMVHPITGEKLELDVIVSAKTVNKRKNFGQVIVALMSLVDNREKIIDDYAKTSIKELENMLVSHGFPASGQSDIRYYDGTKHKAVCGWLFWGISKIPEIQIWTREDIKAKNSLGEQRAGVKVSLIELRALKTIFGKDSHVVREILSHNKNTEEVRVFINMMKSCAGIRQAKVQEVDASVFKPLSGRPFQRKENFQGTIAEEEIYPEGFELKLPLVFWATEAQNGTRIALEAGEGSISFTHIYVPPAKFRDLWRHDVGLFSPTELAVRLNAIVRAGNNRSWLLDAVRNYFNWLSGSVANKPGKLNQKLFNVRYPNSTKATAALALSAPKDHIIIHRYFAKMLNIAEGDIVLVERYPCLGFASIVPQKVLITDNDDYKFVFQVSGNSLISLNLDFDGDVIYIYTFETSGARKEMLKVFHFNDSRKQVIEKLRSVKQPQLIEMSLQDYKIETFPDLTVVDEAAIFKRSASVKAFTGPVIALAYNLMRILETHTRDEDQKVHVNLEAFMDKLGNSVFSLKHPGTVSLREICTEAVCLADKAKLIEIGMGEREAEILTSAIVNSAERIGIQRSQFQDYWQAHVTRGRSNILSLIVRNLHGRYFVSRANTGCLQNLRLLCMNSGDLPSEIFNQFAGKEK